MNININNSKSKNTTSFSINHLTDVIIFSNKKHKKFLNLIIKSNGELFIEKKYKPKSTPRSSRGTPIAKKTNNKDEEEEESEDYIDDETDEEFNEKMKKINQKNPKDNEEMKLYKKENRKMLYRLEDALEDNNELKQKMITIEKIVTKKQNELYKSLKGTFETLVGDFNLTNKNKDSLNYFLKLMNYSQDEINKLLSKKQKGLLGFFK